MTVHTSPKGLTPSVQRSAAQILNPLQREVNRFFDELGSGWQAFTEVRLTPNMDVVNTPDHLEITVELPGMAREDVKISVDDDLLTVSGEKKAEKETKDRSYRVFERTYGEFSRSVYLPPSVDTGKIAATMADGVLRITMPRRSDAGSKTIKIQPA